MGLPSHNSDASNKIRQRTNALLKELDSIRGRLMPVELRVDLVRYRRRRRLFGVAAVANAVGCCIAACTGQPLVAACLGAAALMQLFAFRQVKPLMITSMPDGEISPQCGRPSILA